MISFDNGPAGGDYVRYIEAMAKTAAQAVAATAAARSGAETAAARSGPATGSVANATGFDDTTQGRMREVAARRAPPPSGTMTATNALAAAGRTGAVSALGRAALTMLAGVVLLVVGLVARPTNAIAVVAGIAIAAFGFRRASAAVAALRGRFRLGQP